MLTYEIAAATATASSTSLTFFHPLVERVYALRACTPRMSTVKSKVNINVTAQANVSQLTCARRCPPVSRSTPARMPETASAGPLIVTMPFSRAAMDCLNETFFIDSPSLLCDVSTTLSEPSGQSDTLRSACFQTPSAAFRTRFRHPILLAYPGAG